MCGTLTTEQSKTCRQMAARQRQHLVAAEGVHALQRTFTAYGELELRWVERFKYLGRVLSYDDSDTPAIRRNLKRARAVWGRISVVIDMESVPPPVARMFYPLPPSSSTAARPGSSRPTTSAPWKASMWRPRAASTECGRRQPKRGET